MTRGHVRPAIVAALAAVLLVLPAGAATAAPLLVPPDDQTLSEHLRRATEAQGICYGWDIGVRTETGALRSERGSSLGVGVLPPPGTPQCRETVVLEGDVTYTSEFSDAEDSATWRVRSTVPGVDIAAVERVTGLNARALVGTDDDSAVYSATAALPLLVTEAGAAPPVPVATPSAIPASDRPEGVGAGSDFLRRNAPLLILAGLVLAAGLAALLWGLVLYPFRGTWPPAPTPAHDERNPHAQ